MSRERKREKNKIPNKKEDRKLFYENFNNIQLLGQNGF
jgi:hypothetical protein